MPTAVCAPELLDQLDAVHRAEREAQATKLLVATEFALAQTLDPIEAERPGRERMAQPGGPGTPKVAEFAGAMIGGRLQLSTWSADRLIADGLDLRYRLPLLHARLTAFEIAVGHARLVARKTRHLGADEAALVDARVAESADGRLPWSRFETLVDAAVIEADPTAAAERERAAAEDVCVRRCRPGGRSTGDGMAALFVRGPLDVIAQIDTAVTDVAAALTEIGWAESTVSSDQTQGVGRTRLRALQVLCNPALAVAVLHHRHDRRHGTETPGVHKLVPDQTTLVACALLYVHLAQTTAENDCQGVARVEGEGPISASWVCSHLGLRSGFTIKPVVDPLDQTPVDTYEVPDRHAEAVHLMTPTDCFPYASRVTRQVEIDHTVPFRPHGPPGQSAIGNYGPMTKRHHRIKTHSAWQVRQPFPGIYVWRDPVGAYYLVDHTGTRRLAETA